ncbi:MAG: trehalase family glycosidase, partial [Opitutaceae bacterium]
NLHTIIGTHAYLLHTGDLAFVRQNLPALERMLEYFLQRRNDRGLFVLGGTGAHRHDGTAITSGIWYYDNIITSGVNGYYNAFFYQACGDLADMEAAADRQEKAGAYRAAAQRIKQSFNEVLWKEDAPGGPRYLDWIDAQGKEVDYFCDLCQWPPVAMGIASPGQARKLVATADARLAQLEKTSGYQGFAGLSALWPVPAALDKIGERFGDYMNGGSLLSQTYWEIVARARAGDNEGAARRLRLFARRAAEISWAGDNAANIKGEMAGGDGEPYLADMVVTPAAVISGVMGITPTWERLEVTPHLPAGWPRAEADVLYKGRRHHVVIENGKVQVRPLEQIIDLPLMWTMDFNLRTAPGGPAIGSSMDSIGEWGRAFNWRAVPDPRSAAVATHVDFIEPYGNAVVLGKAAVAGTYQSPPNDWGRPARLTELTVTVDLHGGQGTVTVETSNDAFRTVSSSGPIRLQDGVKGYPLGAGEEPAQMVRLRFELMQGADAAAKPNLDGFRILAKAK